MNQLLNANRAQAQQSAGHTATVRAGIVSGYDPVNYCAKVRLQPDNTETGWLPVLTPWAGNGWGFFAPVTPGDVVEVQFQEGGKEAGFICQRFFNDGIRPLPVPSGEFWLVHQSGSLLKFHNDGSIELHAATNINSSATAWNHTGDINLTGTLTASVDVVSASKSGAHHTHTDPQGGSTGQPA
ncbi:MAG: phage baseplate assembly protein V [Methylobacter sp.]